MNNKISKLSKIPKLDLKGYERDLLIYIYKFLQIHFRQKDLRSQLKQYCNRVVEELLKVNWDVISEGDKRLYIREIKEYKEDYGEKGLGDSCDISSWNSVLELEV